MVFFFRPPFLPGLEHHQMTDISSELPALPESTLPEIGEPSSQDILSPIPTLDQEFPSTDPTKKRCVVVCLDSALAETEWRQLLAEKDDWPEYYDAAIYDSINSSLAAQLDRIHKNDDNSNPISIFILADRPITECANFTKTWLAKYMVKYDEIFFRLANDLRSSDLWKYSQVNLHFRDYDVVAIYDDDPVCYEMWKRFFLPVRDPGRMNRSTPPLNVPYNITNKLFDLEELEWSHYYGAGMYC